MEVEAARAGAGASVAAPPPAPELPLLGNEPLQHSFHLVHYGDRPFPRIEVKGGSTSDLEVSVRFTDERSGLNKVVLSIAAGAQVRIVDLTGNGEGGNKHRRGYGLLVVNVAFQVLRQMYGITDDTPVTGSITDERPRVPNFWRQFGAWQFTEKSATTDGCISGTVGDFEPAERDRKAGGIFDLRLDLSQFRVLKNVGGVPDHRDHPSAQARPRI